MEPISETIKIIFQDLEARDKGAIADDLGGILKKVLAKKALQHVKLYNFRKGVVSIKVDSSTWLYYLSLQKEDLLVKLRKLYKEVKEIRFSLGD